MSHEVSHGKTRVTPPRASDNRDHANGANAVDRTRNHASDGRFRPGNRAAAQSGARRAVRNALVPARGRCLYADVCRQLGADAGTVAFLHAADCIRHYLAAAELGELASAAGLATPAGKELDERATRHGEAGLRASTAALDAARLFRRPGIAKRPRTPPPGFEVSE